MRPTVEKYTKTEVHMMAQIQHIQDQQHDYAERTEHNFSCLIKEMEGMRVWIEDLLEYMKHIGIPLPHHGRYGRARGRGCR